MEDTCVIDSPLTSHKLSFFLLKNDNCVCEFMRNGKYWEAEMCKLMGDLVSHVIDDGTILDVGSFIGTHAVALAEKFISNKVISIEANPDYLSTQIKNIETNKLSNITTINAIVTSEKYLNNVTIRKLDMSRVKNYGGVPIVVSADIVEDGPKSVTIDSLNLQKIKLFKLDVEEHELQVLEGAFNTIINSIPIIFIEIWKNNLKMYIHSEIFKKLFKFGYKLYKIRSSSMDYILIHKSFTYDLPNTIHHVNMYF